MVQQARMVALRGSGIRSWARAAIGSIFSRPEPIEVIEQRFNFLPQCFRWRGAVRQVRHVVSIRDQAGGPAPRRYYEVICHDGGSCVLFQDLCLGTWHVR